MTDHAKAKLRRSGLHTWTRQWVPTPAPTPFELYNTETGEIEANQAMTLAEATERNSELRSHLQPQRWIRAEVEP